MTPLPTKLRAIREKQRRTLEATAAACRVSAMHLAEIEDGTAQPSLATLTKLATVLHVWISIPPDGEPPWVTERAPVRRGKA